MAVIGTCYSLRPPHLLLLLSFLFTTVSVHFTVSSSAEKTSEATSNPNLESKADSTTSAWCLAKKNAEDSVPPANLNLWRTEYSALFFAIHHTGFLHAALNRTCRQVGTDCGPIQLGGPCYDPNDLQFMASYAFNDYSLKHGLTRENCNFGNTADLTALDPSHDNCIFPSSRSFGGTPQTGPGAEGVNGCLAVGGWSWTLIIRPLLFTSTLAFLL